MLRPETSAPLTRVVDAFTGKRAPTTALFRALSEADSFCAEVAEVHELRCRVQELEAEVQELEEEVAHQSELRMNAVRENARLNQLLARAALDRDTAKAEIAGRTP